MRLRVALVAFVAATCAAFFAGFAGLGALPTEVGVGLVALGPLAALLLGPHARASPRPWLPPAADALAGACAALAIPDAVVSLVRAPGLARLVASAVILAAALLALRGVRAWAWAVAGAAAAGLLVALSVGPVLPLAALQVALLYGLLAEASARGFSWGAAAGAALLLAAAGVGALLSTDPERAIRLDERGFVLLVVPVVLAGLLVLPTLGALLAQPRWARDL